MSRHRDVRNMDYTEDYDGYDDIYGHSIDDDYYISPSNRQFLFNRENSREQPKIGEFIRTEQDIQEEDECELATDLTDLEKAKLESCIEQVKSTLGPLSISRNELVNIIISHNYDVEKATDAILNGSKNVQPERKDKDVTNSSSKFFIPRLNGLSESVKSPDNKHPYKSFNVPSLSNLTSVGAAASPKTFVVPKINFSQDKSGLESDANKKFNNLSDLVSSYLSKSFQKTVCVDAVSTNQVNKLTQNIDKLKIQSSPPELRSSQYKIDLSLALKTSPSIQSLTSKSKHDVKEEKFEIPFFDCDVEEETKTILRCDFDIKDVLNIYVNSMKPVSNFGRVLCRKYRRRCRKKIKTDHVKFIKNLPVFNFRTPSPDDAIMKHLKILTNQ